MHREAVVSTDNHRACHYPSAVLEEDVAGLDCMKHSEIFFLEKASKTILFKEK